VQVSLIVRYFGEFCLTGLNSLLVGLDFLLVRLDISCIFLNLLLGLLESLLRWMQPRLDSLSGPQVVSIETDRLRIHLSIRIAGTFYLNFESGDECGYRHTFFANTQFPLLRPNRRVISHVDDNVVTFLGPQRQSVSGPGSDKTLNFDFLAARHLSGRTMVYGQYHEY